jgi:formylglycine-generating enzyme required for sulfatase activity
VSSGIHLLCIGISRYGHAPLTSGALSALRVHQTFARLAGARGLRLPLKSAELVVDPDPIETELVARLAPADAALFARSSRTVTRSELDRVFNAWFSAVRVAEDDIAVLYFAGHGLGLDEKPGDESKTLLLARDYDANFRRPPRAITLEHVLSGLQPASHADSVARRQLYLLDCCRTRGWDGPPAEQGDLEIEIANRRAVDPSTPDDRQIAVQYACRAGDEAFTDDNKLGANALVTTNFAHALIATLERLQDSPELRAEHLLRHVAVTLEQHCPAQQARRGRFDDFALRVFESERVLKPMAVVARDPQADALAPTALPDAVDARRGSPAAERALGMAARSPEPAASLGQATSGAASVWKRLAIPGALVALALAGLVAIVGTRAHGQAAPAPAEMIGLPGASYSAGSSPAEAESAHRECLEYAGVHGWLGRKELPCSVPLAASWFARETRSFGTSVALRPFFIDRTEVTNRAFAAWLNESKERLVLIDEGEDHTPRVAFDHGEPFVSVLTSARTPGVRLELRAGMYQSTEGDADRPVVKVTWLGAEAYCKAHGKRLPSEVEWEYAARGSAHRRAPWGDAAPTCRRVTIGLFGWQECANAVAEPSPVGSSEQDRTPEGVSDLAGNVAEWTADAYLSVPGEAPCVAAPGHTCRVVRGAGFGDFGLMARSAFRARFDENGSATNIGFRCAKDAP